MRKTITLLILSFFISATLYAGPVDAERAREIAISFWNNNTTLRENGELQPIPEAGMARAASRNTATANNAQYYIFSTTEKSGFVIISGDDRLTPIVGYSDNCNIDEMPPALAEWLSEYSSYVDEVRAGTAEPLLHSTTTTEGTAIAPMLKTSWNQSAPYNNFCPKIGTQTPPTGCTATAMAQVMKFHEWPASPKRAISWNNNITGKTETIDITKNVYDWDNMLPHYRNGYTQAQADAVAQLMVDVGKAIQSNYDLSGTGSNEASAARGLVNVFDYSPEIKVIKRNEYTYDEFISIIRENLEARQPIIHTGHGQSYEAGHAFVCDGIDKDNLLHIDWGWDGAYNGYFDIGSMAPGGSGIGGGQDRYNVGQAMIVNIRPRQADEADRNGDPTLYVYDIADLNSNEIVDEYSATFVNGKAQFKLIVAFLNWSHSTVKMNYGFCITNEDGSFKNLDIDYENVEIIDQNGSIGYYYTFTIGNSPSGNYFYLPEGNYKIEVYYKDNDGNEVPMRGENNSITLKVDATGLKVSKTLPQIEVAGFQFRSAPQVQRDKMEFDVAFKNKNTHNSTVVIVPIVNRVENGAVVKSDTLASNGVLINVLDNTNLITTFTANDCFTDVGDYYISFAYDMRNSYTNHEVTIDKKRLKSVEGKSYTFNIIKLPDGAFPKIKSITAEDVSMGSKLNIVADIYNATVTNTKYNGTLGLFAEKDGHYTMLTSTEVVDLKAGNSITLKYNSSDYFPALGVGKYNIQVRELKDGWWESISNTRNSFTISEQNGNMLYVSNRLRVGNGTIVTPGDSIDTYTEITSTYSDFDGYVRINVSQGLKSILRSNYIPVTIKKDETLGINIRSLCNKTTPYGKWVISIDYYDNNKTKLGNVSNNNITFPDNGVFYVHDATGIETTGESLATVTAGNGAISVENVAPNTVIGVYTLDGRQIYRGTDTTIATEKGIYLVTIEESGKEAVTTKAFVK